MVHHLPPPILIRLSWWFMNWWIVIMISPDDHHALRDVMNMTLKGGNHLLEVDSDHNLCHDHEEGHGETFYNVFKQILGLY
eukprot:UN10495